MSKLSTVGTLLRQGGINAVLFKIEDRIRGTHYYHQYMQRILEAIDPEEYPRILQDTWKKRMGENVPLDLDHPQSFNEKIQWIKLHDITPLMTKLADKYLVREWIAEQIGDQYLIPLLGVWDSFDEIDFEQLPNRFVLKCNHGSGMNLVVKDKNSIDMAVAKTQFDQWIATNYAFAGMGLELQYKNIPRKIIAEEYIEQMDADLLDYKIHCFGGEPQIIQIIGNRDNEHHTAREAFFDLDWNQAELMYHTYDSYEKLPEKPENLEEMLRLSRILSKDFRYVRVDWYDLSGNIKFGEMTFTPANGYGNWGGEEQYLVGSWINTDN